MYFSASAELWMGFIHSDELICHIEIIICSPSILTGSMFYVWENPHFQNLFSRDVQLVPKIYHDICFAEQKLNLSWT